MGTIVTAVYEHSVLRPLHPLDLEQNQTVRLQVLPEPSDDAERMIQTLVRAGLLMPPQVILRSPPRPKRNASNWPRFWVGRAANPCPKSSLRSGTSGVDAFRYDLDMQHRLSSWIEQKLVLRAQAGQPVITCNCSQRIPDHRTSIQGLYLANALPIYPEDRGTNYSVWLGQTFSRRVDQDLKHHA